MRGGVKLDAASWSPAAPRDKAFGVGVTSNELASWLVTGALFLLLACTDSSKQPVDTGVGDSDPLGGDSAGAPDSAESGGFVDTADSAGDTGEADAFDLEQTLSDGAQRYTLAFSGFAMVTGNLQAQSFFPPGKVADYWGFQALRDNDPDGMGHNTSFLTRVADNVLAVLSADQVALLSELATSQAATNEAYGYGRYTLMAASRRLLEGDLPEGTSSLDAEAVRAVSAELYRLDGQMSFERAVVYAEIYRTLDADQRASLDAMVGQGFEGWPDITDDDIADVLEALPRGSADDVRTFAGDLFSWYAGSVDADVYFCPERHGTYYGSFYVKDAPATGHEGYSIDPQMTAETGAAFLEILARTGLDSLVTDLVDAQRDDLYAGETNMVAAREQISTLLRGLRTDEAPSEEALEELRAAVLEASATYGELDGGLNHRYAVAFAAVAQGLDADQAEELSLLRASVLSGTYDDGTPFDDTVADTYYLYSTAIDDASTLEPWLVAADGLFAP